MCFGQSFPEGAGRAVPSKGGDGPASAAAEGKDVPLCWCSIDNHAANYFISMLDSGWEVSELATQGKDPV